MSDDNGKKSKKVFDTPSLGAYNFDPKHLIIIGLDTEDGPEHALYDSRIKLDVSEEMINSVAVHGVIQAVTITKDGERAVVVAGRQRVRAARLVNEARAAAGQPLIMVPALPLSRGRSSAETGGAALAENAMRVNDDALATGEKAAAYLRIHGDTPDNRKLLMVSLGLNNAQRLDSLLKLREAAPAIINAVQSGALGVAAALSLAQLPQGEQAAVLIELQAETVDGAVAADRAREAVAAVKGAKKGKTARPSGVTIRRVLAAGAGMENDAEIAPILAALRWVSGDVSADDVPLIKTLLDLAPKVEASAKTAGKLIKEATKAATKATKAALPKGKPGRKPKVVVAAAATGDIPFPGAVEVIVTAVPVEGTVNGATTVDMGRVPAELQDLPEAELREMLSADGVFPWEMGA